MGRKLNQAGDLTGRTFSRLTVLHSERNKWGQTAWKCQCICGKVTLVMPHELIHGGTVSCGCYAQDQKVQRAKASQINRTDLTGKEFGYLTVLHFERKATGHPAWKCQCICGKVTVVRTGDLMHGKVASCGCKQRVAQTKLTPDQVLAMRQEYAKGGGSTEELGAKYGVHNATVSLLLRGETWKDVGGPLTRPETDLEIIERFQCSYLKPVDPKRRLSDLDAASIFSLRGDT